MDNGSREEIQSRLALRALREAGLSVAQVWAHYMGLTGRAGEYEVDAYLNGLMALPALERDLISHAVNELADLPPARRAPYSHRAGAGTRARARPRNG